MKTIFPAIFLVAILSGHVMVTSATNWGRFARCLKDGLGVRALLDPEVICGATRMAWSFAHMTYYSCLNCDKYFHCKGNYNAVIGCGGSPGARMAAETISNCREFSQGGMDADGMADDEANRFGRGGGDCESRYLCDVNCKFNPRGNTCLETNC